VPYWGLIVEQNDAGGYRGWTSQELERVDGAWEQAMDRLWHHVRNLRLNHPHRPSRWVIYREPTGYLMFVHGMMSVYHARFRVAELVYDSDAPGPSLTKDSPPPHRQGGGA